MIGVEKKVEATEGNSYTLKGGEFSFVITGSANAPMPTDVKISNDANGKASFGGIVFDKVGTYVYTVVEEQGSLGGMTYDSTEYTVTVVVTDNTEDAKLETAVTVTDKDGKPAELIFNNKYDPKATSAIIFGGKALESDHKELEADEFKFKLEAVAANAPMPAETTVTNTASGTFRFDTITYTKVGVYEYKVTEVDLGEKGYTYDDEVFTVKVTVTDENGELKAVVEGVGSTDSPEVKFVNKYVPASTELTLGEEGELNKTLDGRDLDAEFEFVLTDSNNKVVDTVKNDKNGKFEFTLEFTKAGTYKYTITEKNNGLGGITYDESVYGVTVTVVDKGGYLEVSDYGYELESESVEEVEFKNTYKATPVEVQVEASKRFENADLLKGDFKFELKDSDGKVVKTAENEANGKVVFEKLKFEKVGTYKYTLAEVAGNAEGVTYDKTVYTVEIVVTDYGKGALVASKPVYKKAESDTALTEVTFVNKYDVPNVPQTGDSTHLDMWFVLFFISGLGVAVTPFFGKKRRAKANIK